jgi:hypothetical protein
MLIAEYVAYYGKFAAFIIAFKGYEKYTGAKWELVWIRTIVDYSTSQRRT